MKPILYITLILIVAVILVGYFFFLQQDKAQVCFEYHCFNVEIADNLTTQKTGLMFRKELEENAGMLFIFSKEGIYPFWMKNTLIPLDIIWMNENKEIVFISENTQPCKNDPCPDINPEKNAKYVLEINAGLSREIGLSVGSKLELK